MRLTQDQIRKYKVELSRWYSPSEMIDCADTLMDKLGVTDLFSQPGIEFVREAWIAGHFGKQRRAKFVRWIAEERPDFSLQFSDGSTENYELVEADAPDRRRGNEYKHAASGGHPLRNASIVQWATPQMTLKIIQAAVNRKTTRAEKLQRQGIPYPSETRLLIYLNIGGSEVHQREIENIFSQAVEPARRWFSSIWIFWQMRIYEV